MTATHQRIVLTFPFALGVPGGGTHDCVNTALALAACGSQVSVLAVQVHVHGRFPRAVLPAEYAGEPVVRRLLDAGIEVVPVRPSRLHYMLDARQVRAAVARIVQSEPVDAVISYWQEGMLLPSLASRFGFAYGVVAAASYRQWLNGTGSSRETGSRIRRLVKKLLVQPARRYLRQPLHRFRSQRIVGDALRRADFVIARSEFTAAEVIDLFGVEQRRVAVAHCGIDAEFAECRRESDDDRGHDLIYVGALVERKGIFDVIEALGMLPHKRAYDWRLRVAGWGDASRVQRAAADAGIADRVEVLGPLDREALLRQLARADLAIMPSYSESFGLAIGEAQASGVPVVAYAAGAVPEVVADGITGWLASPGDVAGLSRLIDYALSHRSDRLRAGEAARDRVASRFSWQNSSRQIAAALRGVGQRRRSS